MISPSSTYRVQLRAEFDLTALAEVADYLAALGVGAVYTSPMLQATSGSTHGYDVVDPGRVSAELGGEEARTALASRLRSLELGHVLDIVPNHMGVERVPENPWWCDVLRNGPSSVYASHFDIDSWPILVPVLGSDSDEPGVDGDWLTYYEHRFPIAPGTGDGSPAEVRGRQHYRLVDWRRASAELNYRRFFDINTLAAVRVEDPPVFVDTHAEVLRWVGDGDVTGLRVDHPDGLTDPGGYLRRLRAHAPNAWLVVEKILAVGESGVSEALPPSWPVDGTTGYDALREVCGVFVDPAGEGPLTALAGELPSLSTMELSAKRAVVVGALRAEVLRIAELVPEFSVDLAERAVGELLAQFAVYRSYLPYGRVELDAAVERAAAVLPDCVEVLRAIGARMVAEPHGELADRVQQTSGMVMAKGVEDTTFYRYPRLVALNEVGGAPDRFGVSVAELHAAFAAREAGSPASMTALSTHDTKRSEDVRARIAVLAEVPSEFAAFLAALREHAAIPEPTLELLAAQTLVGAWPIDAGRLGEYLLKAAREAKVRTTWTDNDAEFESAVTSWASTVAGDPGGLVSGFVATVRDAGWVNSLGQKAVQLAGPGVPDVYQGTECWDDSLVDPDNRRPVDYERRRALLSELDGGALPELDGSGAAKLLVCSRILRLRRDSPGLFRGYRALHADGPAAGHLVGYLRDGLAVLATRLPVGLARAGGWADTTVTLPDGHWTDELTGTVHDGPDVALGEVLGRYPVAVLVRR